MPNMFDDPVAGPAAPRNMFDDDDASSNPLGFPQRPAAPPAPPPGDFMAGARTALGQTPALIKGAIGLGAGTLEKLFGEGGVSTGVKNWALEGFQRDMAEVAKLQQENHDVTVAWEKAKQGDLGALVDFVQYAAGYGLAQIAESALAMVAGSLIGGAAGGAAAPATAAAGAAAGALKKGVIKDWAERWVSNAVAKAVAESGGKLTVKEAAKQLGAKWGANAALVGWGITQETGSIYPEAVEQAAKEGREMTGADIARVWAYGIGAGLVEAGADKFQLDAVLGRSGALKAAFGKLGAIPRGAIGGGVGLIVEPGTELLQTGMEYLGAGKDPTSPEAQHEYLNAAAMAAVPGFGAGVVGGVMSKQRPPAPQPTGELAPGEIYNEIGRAGSVDEAILIAGALTETGAPMTEVQLLSERALMSKAAEEAQAFLRERDWNALQAAQSAQTGAEVSQAFDARERRLGAVEDAQRGIGQEQMIAARGDEALDLEMAAAKAAGMEAPAGPTALGVAMERELARLSSRLMEGDPAKLRTTQLEMLAARAPDPAVRARAVEIVSTRRNADATALAEAQSTEANRGALEQTNAPAAAPDADTVFSRPRESAVQSPQAPGFTGASDYLAAPGPENDAAAVEGLNRALAREAQGRDGAAPTGWQAVDVTTLPVDDTPLPGSPVGAMARSQESVRLAQGFAALFGKRVVPIRNLAAQDGDFMGGTVLGGDRERVFLNVDSPDASPVTIAGHETYHQMEADAPDLAAGVRRAIGLEGGKAIDAAHPLVGFYRYYEGGANLTDEQVVAELAKPAVLEKMKREIAADFFGNRAGEYSTLKTIFKAIGDSEDKGLIYKVASYIMQAIDAILRRVKTQKFEVSDQLVSRLVKDLEGAKQAVRDAMGEYAKRQGLTKMQAEAAIREAMVSRAKAAAAPAPRLDKNQIPILSKQRSDAGSFQYTTQKDGSIDVVGDPAAMRALLPPGIRGRATPTGLRFSPNAAHRVVSALKGDRLTYGRGGLVSERHPVKNGVYVGAPERFNTPAKLPHLRRILRGLANEGAPGRFWYERSSEAVLKFVGGDVQEARKFVALLAIYSPQAKVDANSTFALRAWAQYKAGQPISVKTRVTDSKAQSALDDVDAFWSGEKTGNFFFNLLSEIDPATKGKHGATIDMWMMRAGQYDTDAPNTSQYRFMEVETNRLAKELGWEPQQVQAAIWVAMKARMENSGVKKRTEAKSVKAGYMRYVQREKNGKSTRVRDVLNEQKHRDLWLKEAFALDVSAEDTAAAKFDFADGIRRHVGQVSWEARPSTSVDLLPGVHTAPYEQQLEFQQAMVKALHDENGVDLLAQQLGLLTDGLIITPGVWEATVSPSTQVDVAMPPDAGATAGPIDPAIAKMLDVYTSILGLLLKQDGVGWHRPFYAATKKAANGVDINVGRQLTGEETTALYAAIDSAIGKPGWNDALAIITTPMGVRLVNFGAVDNAFLHRELIAAAGTVLPNGTTRTFASSGNMPTNNWKEFPDGQTYRQRARAEGRSDVLDWATSVLAPRVDAVVKEFGERYGWNAPRLAKSALRSGGGSVAPSGSVWSKRDPQPGAVEVAGWHYGRERVPVLSGRMFGTGIKGKEADRVAAATDPRIKRRVYFYTDKGNGTKPVKEAGLGPHRYDVRLGNLYDPRQPDPRVERPRQPMDVDRVTYEQAALNAWESSLLDAGYDGYVNPDHGIAVVLDADVPVTYSGVDYLGPAPAAPAPPSLLKQALMSAEIDPVTEAIAGIPGARVRMGTLEVATGSIDQVNAALASAGVNVQMSRQRVTDSAAFVRWFGDSVVREKGRIPGEDGPPMLMYHSTTEDFDAFNEFDTLGQHFGTWKAAHERLNDLGTRREAKDRMPGSRIPLGANVMPVYLRIEKPLRMKDVGNWMDSMYVAMQLADAKELSKHARQQIVDIRFDVEEAQRQFENSELPDDYFTDENDNPVTPPDWASPWTVSAENANALTEIRSILEMDGFDGIVYTNQVEHAGTDSYIAFRSEQVKSAIGNNGQYADVADITKSAQRVTDTPEFKRWFGNSKAVVQTGGTSSRDAKFSPQHMYHTTRNAFDAFEVGRPATNSTTFGDVETTRNAIFVTPDAGASQAYGTREGRPVEGANTMPLYVKAENPLDLADGLTERDEARLLAAGLDSRFIHNRLAHWEVFDGEEGKALVETLKSAGYDSVIFNDENPDTGDSFESWAIFAPEQIKSAIGNRGTFDATSPDITKSRQRVTATPEFRRWFADSKVVDENGEPLVVYHGSPARGFTKFDVNAINQRDPDGPYNGFWFSSSYDDARAAGTFPWGRPNAPEAETRAFYLAIKNPATRKEAGVVAREIANKWDKEYPGARSLQDAVRLELQKRGYDGVIHEPYTAPSREDFERDGKVPLGKNGETLLRNEEFGGVDLLDRNGEVVTGYIDFDDALEQLQHGTFVAFRPEQIKSATGNSGAFDPTNPDITKSRQRVTATPEFRRWFGNSKVVDENGRPLVVYHGTAASFDRFKPGPGWYVYGIHFTDSAHFAGEFADMSADEGGGENIVPVYLSLQRPYVFRPRSEREATNVALMKEISDALGTHAKWSDEYIEGAIERGVHHGLVKGRLQAMGHDGLIVLSPGENEYIAFDPEQIKSATGNNGQFDPGNPDITKSRQRVTATPEFRRWFADSKVVDENGEPLVVYHGTQYDFSAFDPEMQGDTVWSEDVGFFFTNDPVEASAYATLDWDREAPKPNVMPAYLSLQNPMVVELLDEESPYENPARWYDEEGRDAVQMAIEEGHDGLIVRDMRDDMIENGIRPTLYIAFRPEQIKSATGNSGAFDPGNPDITKSRQRGTATPEFRRWFAGSQVVDENGEPLVVYHGTTSDIKRFSLAKSRGGFYFTPNAKDAYPSKRGQMNSDRGLNVMPAYLALKNPLRTSDPADWHALDTAARSALEARGFDGVIVENPDGSLREFVAFRPEQVKSVFNEGAFDPANPNITKSAPRDRSPYLGALTPAQEAALRTAGAIVQPQTWQQRWSEFKTGLGQRAIQGVFDQFDPIKHLDQEAYMQARMSRGSDGTLEAVMLYGRPFLRDGVPDVDVNDRGFAKVLADLGTDTDRFFWWVAAKRAEQLKREGRENLLTDQDITDLLTLNQPDPNDPATVDRSARFSRALASLNEFNEAMLKIAKESDLIDQDAYDLFRTQPYVPFYRVMEEEGGVRGPGFGKGLVSQYAWKKLKGGSQALNQDLLANLLRNWSHLLSASAKNRAAVSTMVAAIPLGVVQHVPSGTPKAVRVRVDGKEQHFLIEDPHLLEAISAIEYATPRWFKPFSTFKRWLTIGVTASPAFKIRNLIRDSVQAIATGQLEGNPIKNVAQGFKASHRDKQTYASMLASGGMMRFGSLIEGDRSVHAQNLIDKAGRAGHILDESGWKKLQKQMTSLIEAYNELGDRGENVNRNALYKQLRARGHSHLEASFMARDLMDFAMGGTWPVVRFLTQSVPFLNARLQGLYKLGRSAKDDPKRVGYVVGAVTLASLALLLIHGDDEDWKRREDWDRDNYWWFKIGETAFRIPKPFEIGAFGTLAERTWELMFDKEMTGKRYGKRLLNTISEQFAMNPVPQIVKPVVDLYANKDSFTGRAIEGMAMARLRPEDRARAGTSTIAVALGKLGLPNPAQLANARYDPLSPVQIDHLVRGYFGWLGTVITSGLDYGLRPMTDRGPRPEMRLKDVFLAGSFVETLPPNTSRYVTEMYDQAQQAEQWWASYRDALKYGDRERAAEIMAERREELVKARRLSGSTEAASQLGQQIRRIEASTSLSPETKRKMIDALEQRRHELARRAVSP